MEFLCGCGCGTTTYRKNLPPSVIKNQGPIRYVRGHQNRGKVHTEEHKRKGARALEKNGRWNGGRMMDADGYVLIKMRDHPYATKAGYVREHRLVVEKRIGRYLLPEEVVHHINSVKDDNRDENLQFVESQAEHNRVERVGKKYPRPTTLRLICERCGEMFYRQPSYLSFGSGRFCSWKCRYPHTSRITKIELAAKVT